MRISPNYNTANNYSRALQVIEKRVTGLSVALAVEQKETVTRLPADRCGRHTSILKRQDQNGSETRINESQ